MSLPAPITSLALLLAAIGVAGPAAAMDLENWNVAPPTAEWGNWSGTLGGRVSGAGYLTDDGARRIGVTGAVYLAPRLRWQADNGWVLTLHADILAFHDALSGDIYGDRVVEQAYAVLQTPYGRIAAGREDGGAYALSVTGPKIDEAVSLDAPQTVFFRDPLTGSSMFERFRLVTGEFGSANDAKLSYYSPRLFGLAIGASYAPSTAGDGTLVGQKNLLEAAISDQHNFGAASFEGYGGIVHGFAAGASFPRSDLRDYGFGGKLDYDFGGATVSGGASYRISNDYAFAPGEVLPGEDTHALHLAGEITFGAWIAGMEFITGTAGGVLGHATTREKGFQPSIAYVLNSNLQFTLGWQHMHLPACAICQGSEGGYASAGYSNAVYMHFLFHV